ncbi:protein ABIL2-like [Amborella trichopoda]|uniref:protein ABIL2-like n=1 Tax=Amborella trichopoda TaxID=13333 RepID=UPI0009BE6176|nr:protein ABIL2-like [Amborella trichopoda]|eukprot:XP_011620959.2 protein ABIL2-like [Amborella trichopoda]
MQEALHSSNYDETSMDQALHFTQSLLELRDLRRQLYTAAESFESSFSFYSHHAQDREMVLETLKAYVSKALVNTVDHIGSLIIKLNDAISEKQHELMATQIRIGCLQQGLYTCGEYTCNEGLKEQAFFNSQQVRYHKLYIKPGARARTVEGSAYFGRKNNSVSLAEVLGTFYIPKKAGTCTRRLCPPSPHALVSHGHDAYTVDVASSFMLMRGMNSKRLSNYCCNLFWTPCTSEEKPETKNDWYI